MSTVGLAIPHPAEFVPPQVADTLQTFGWKSTYCDGKCLFTREGFGGYFSWSEALVLETSRAFLELHK